VDIDDLFSPEKENDKLSSEKSMVDISLDISESDVDYSGENSSNRRRGKLNSLYAACASWLLWFAFTLIILSSIAFIIACATLYVSSYRSKSFGLDNLFGNSSDLVTVEKIRIEFDDGSDETTTDDSNVTTHINTTKSLKPTNLADFEIDFNFEDNPTTIKPSLDLHPDEESSEVFEDTLRDEINKVLNRPLDGIDDFRSRFPFHTGSTVVENNSNYVPGLGHKHLEKPPTINDLFTFVKRLLRIEENVFKTNL